MSTRDATGAYLIYRFSHGLGSSILNYELERGGVCKGTKQTEGKANSLSFETSTYVPGSFPIHASVCFLEILSDAKVDTKLESSHPFVCRSNLVTLKVKVKVNHSNIQTRASCKSPPPLKPPEYRACQQPTKIMRMSNQPTNQKKHPHEKANCMRKATRTHK